jgi:choline dehydrogenase
VSNRTYNYVIVGAGSAECVLAARLSEDLKARVVLVEAGVVDAAPEIHIPAAFPMLFKTQYDWDYSSGPEVALGERMIEIFHHGQTQTLLAEDEVILCAGTYNSPQILMLSGIGKASDLRPLGIEVKHDLPLGEDLQDHPWTVLSYFTDVPTLFGAGTPDDVALFQREGSGPLSSNLSESGAFLRAKASLDVPDVGLYAGAVMYRDQGLSPPTDHAYTIGPSVLKPTSRGKVSLRSARPDAKPQISCNLLATPEDRRTLIAGVELTVHIAEMPELAAVRRPRAAHMAPASSKERDIWAFIQKRTQVIYHPTSSCAIGKVVDPALRVLGVDQLRVVDASVMPAVIRGNTNAPVIAIAEKAADLIRGRPPLRLHLPPENECGPSTLA